MTEPANRMAAALAVFSNEPGIWVQMGYSPAECLDICREFDLCGLAYEQINRSEQHDAWPAAFQEGLSRIVRDETACELIRREEIAAVLDALGGDGARTLVFKGTALAYTVYESPVARPRLDTDLLIAQDSQDRARAVLERCGYSAPPYCADLFAQFEMTRTDRFDLTHVFDVHWKISTQPVFADALTYGELIERAVPVPALGSAAWSPCAVHALLLACIHPVMHHRNESRLLWLYDIHLLAGTLNESEVTEFVRVARERKMAGVCAHGLRMARSMFSTAISAEVIADLDSRDRHEPSAEYLASERKWHHETLASMRALNGLGDRLRFAREVLLPSPEYMLGSYGLRGKPLGAWLLPALYVHRNVRGAWKILAGKK